MPTRRAVRVTQKLAEQIQKEVERGSYGSLSEFVSEAIRWKLEALAEEAALERVARVRLTAVREYTCTNSLVHRVKVARFDDSSAWVMCPFFGWYPAVAGGGSKLGCGDRKRNCTWFVG